MSRNIFKIYDGRNYFWQWDIDQKLIVLDDTINEVHFSNKYMTHAIPKDVVADKDGLRVCHIPDSLFTIAKTFTASAYATDDSGVQRMRSVKYAVRPRPIPADYIVSEDFKLEDFDERLDTFEDIVENGCLIQKFNTIEEARQWAKDTRKLGAVITVKVDSKWLAYVVDDDFSIYPIYNGDEEALISDIIDLKNLVGDMPVIDRIENVIENLDLPSKYDAKGAAQTVQDNLDEYKTSNERTIYNIMVATNDAQDYVDELAEKVGKVPANKTVIQLIDDVKASVNNYDDSAIRGLIGDNASAINDIVKDYLKADDKAELADAIALKADKSAVDGIISDYLKAADKTALEAKITAEENARKAADQDLDGRLAGVEAFFKLSEGEQLNEALDTLVEIQEYIVNNSASEQIVADVVKNTADIAAIKDGELIDSFADVETVVSVLGESVNDEIAMLNEDVAHEIRDRKDADKAMSDRIDNIHIHDNKSVLDNISAEKIATWDAVEANIVSMQIELDNKVEHSSKIIYEDATLPDALSWRSVTYGDGKFVAIAWNSSVAAYSEDGITWIETTLPISGQWRSVTYGNGKFVATADSSSVAVYSEDGIIWEQTILPISGQWRSVTYGNGKFVAITCENGHYAVYSEDGITWEQTTLPISDSWMSVTYGDGKFVAISKDSLAAYSEDGITWIETTFLASRYWRSVTYGNGKFVAITYSDTIAAYSEDGITWKQVSLISYSNWQSVVYGNGKFVVVGNGEHTAYSENGITWRKNALSTSVQLRSVTYGDGKFVAIADSSSIIAYSEDGITWKNQKEVEIPILSKNNIDITENTANIIKPYLNLTVASLTMDQLIELAKLLKEV